jgi:hypothetical protein
VVNAATVANAMIDAHKLADAILDALERVGDRQDYYRLNHANKEQIDELKEFLRQWLQRVIK